MIEISNLMGIDPNLALTFLIMKILKEKFLVEIIIMPPKLIEKYNDLAREASSEWR